MCVFDEPTSGLDRAHMLDTARNLRELSNQGVTCLVITHDPELVACCCDEALFLENGRVSWSGLLSDMEVSRRLRSISHDGSNVGAVQVRSVHARLPWGGALSCAYLWKRDGSPRLWTLRVFLRLRNRTACRCGGSETWHLPQPKPHRTA